MEGALRPASHHRNPRLSQPVPDARPQYRFGLQFDDGDDRGPGSIHRALHSTTGAVRRFDDDAPQRARGESVPVYPALPRPHRIIRGMPGMVQGCERSGSFDLAEPDHRISQTLAESEVTRVRADLARAAAMWKAGRRPTSHQ